MRGLLAVSFAMLIWGSQAVASLPAEGGRERSGQLQTIQSWTAHLNQYYPALNLKISCKLDRAQAIQGVLHELKSLEDSLQGAARLPKDSLLHLACTRPECGGGGGGGICKTCLAPDVDQNQDTL